MSDRRKPVEISQPKARPGDEVSVENWRMRPPMWEHGECTHASFVVSQDGRGGSWDYRVILNRRNGRGMYLHLNVTDEQIERDV